MATIRGSQILILLPHMHQIGEFNEFDENMPEDDLEEEEEEDDLEDFEQGGHGKEMEFSGTQDFDKLTKRQKEKLQGKDKVPSSLLSLMDQVSPPPPISPLTSSTTLEGKRVISA